MASHRTPGRTKGSSIDFDRLCAEMKAAKARMSGRTLAEIDEDIHRERMAILEDDPPMPGEPSLVYCARMIRRHGSGYADAALERYQGATDREGLAMKAAERELGRFMLPKRRGR